MTKIGKENDKEKRAYEKKFKSWINPAEEGLWAKLFDLRDALDIIEKQGLKEPIQREILEKCRGRIEAAKTSIDPGWRGFPWLPILKKNYAVFWSLAHRIDEDILLLIPDEEVIGKTMDVKTFFSLNVKEEKIRQEWLGGNGQKGKLTDAIEDLDKGINILQNKHVVKEALRVVNDLMDRSFWTLSLNTMVTLLSGVLLGITMFVLWRNPDLFVLKQPAEYSIRKVAVLVALLGLIGAYLSNLMTKEDFLFVKGPFWRHLFHYVVSKPVVSAFAAIFIYALERSKLIFSINSSAVAQNADAAQTTTGQIINLYVAPDAIGYVYAILAIASGFSADKILRSMIDRVLKRLEEKAEKTKETKTEAA